MSKGSLLCRHYDQNSQPFFDLTRKDISGKNLSWPTLPLRPRLPPTLPYCMVEDFRNGRCCTRRMERKLQNVERQQATYDLLVSVPVMSRKIRSNQAPRKRKGKTNKYLSRNLFLRNLVRIKTCPAPCKRGLMPKKLWNKLGSKAKTTNSFSCHAKLIQYFLLLFLYVSCDIKL